MKPTSVAISIVDDEPFLRDSIASFLKTTGHFRCVSQYGRAEEALAKLPDDKPDVVLMDIKMQGMNGIECVRHLKGKMPAVQVVMLTVFEDTDLIFSALKAGASGYLLKRQPPAKLVEAINEVVNGGSPMSAPIARKVVELLQGGDLRPPKNASTKFELSERELQVLEQLAAGQVYKQIADSLNVSVHTVRSYARRIYEKLHVQSRVEAVAKFLQ